MKFSIKERKKNPLMKREEVLLSISHEGKPTPNRIQSLDEVAKLLGTPKENVIIDRIVTSGGGTLSEARVLAYKKKDDIPAWRLKQMEQRMAKVKQPSGKEEAPKPPESPEAASEEEAGSAESHPELHREHPREHG